MENLTKELNPARAPESGLATANIQINLRINGAAHTLRIEPRVSLLDALRENLDLTGTKKRL